MIKNSTWARTLLFLFISWHSSGSPLECPIIEHQLQKDYKKLCLFSEQMKRYDVRVSDFSTFFQKGLEMSLAFYEASCSPPSITAIKNFERKICQDSLLNHQIKKQHLSKEFQSPFKVLDRFSGKWFGTWKGMEVRHLWLPLQKCHASQAMGYELIGYQSCFTGDGFGWNYILRNDTDVLVLGYVYHFKKNGLSYGCPHFGFANESGGLTWVSNDHLYYELLCQNPSCHLGKHYVISAVPYASIQKPSYAKRIQAVYKSVDPNLKTNVLQ